MFAVCIEYLTGCVRAALPAQRDEAEWPPHPDRVFMALAAAHFETGARDSEQAALRWLETLPPPELHAARNASRRTTTTAFVPVNDDSSPLRKNQPIPPTGSCPLGRVRQPRCFPVAVPDDPVVRFVWPDATATADAGDALELLCRKVAYVGHSSSLVRMWVEREPAEPPLPVLAPTSHSSRHRLRIFGPGRLQQLRDLYNGAALDAYAGMLGRLNDARAELGSVKGAARRTAKGRVAELEAELDRHFPTPPQTQRPTPALWSGYDEPAPRVEPATVPHTVFESDLVVLRGVTPSRFGLESTALLIRTVRDTILSTCVDPIPEWVSGHTPGGEPSQAPHLALVPLPHIGREHADGHLLGLALVIPRGVELSERRRCLTPLLFDRLGTPAPITLKLGRLGEWTLELDERDARPLALRPDTWTDVASAASHPWASDGRHWATVTPIVLDRHPKPKDPDAYWADVEAVVRTACQRVLAAAQPANVTNVILSPVSVFEGVPHARRFPNLQRKQGGNLHHTHAVITFDRPILGPLLVGAGRYRGYGFCRPLQGRVPT